MTGLGSVIGWEVWRHLRNKQFIIGVFLTPLIFVLFAAVPQLLSELDRPQVAHYGVVDEIGAFDALSASLGRSEAVALRREEEFTGAAEKVRSGEIAGVLVLDEGFLNTGEAVIYAREAKFGVPSELRAALSQVLQQRRIEAMGLDPGAVTYVTASAGVVQRPLEPEDGDGFGIDPARMATTIGVAVVLAYLVLSSGAMLMQSALQEKRDRMSEVVLSSINARTLMAGKITGHLILGVLQMALWIAIGLGIAAGLLDFPVARWIAWELLPLCLGFFLVGYLFFAALFVGVGATMEDIQSASNSQGMVFMLPFTAVLFIGPAFANPDGAVSRIGTYLPFSSPFIVMLRTATGDLPAWELAIAAAILLASTVAVVLIAAKLFRVGMLMYGKSATPREIWRWLRHG